MDYRNIEKKLLKIRISKRIFFRKKGLAELYSGQFPILKYIVNNEGCTQKEIAEFLFVTPASVATSVKRLEKSGLIKKKADEKNLRCNNISATEKGKVCYEIHKKLADEFSRSMFEGISEEELEKFSEILEKIIINIDNEFSGEIPEIGKICRKREE